MSDMAFVLLYDMHLSNRVGPKSYTDPTLTPQLSNLTIITLHTVTVWSMFDNRRG